MARNIDSLLDSEAIYFYYISVDAQATLLLFQIYISWLLFLKELLLYLFMQLNETWRSNC